ncbi:GTPase IMAP family member 7 [Patella vulgata]|uniref:GTPase IMAP family member 7 n=1 Tax=Patella vulgata TaxID=6465 RepID=UPI00217F2323|nr:GTPase IMAP family member 7 [Patella vulgata]XP_050397138.1 GTPase IMAP family member 7 [Patella vulgata]XP_050397209.1 GTPase IMAP family member 7 [Patella vulgata]XP_050397280.1 GTPase IMAP family member 7 [Patella vulgata]
MAESSIKNEIRMVMVGKTGVGKSALGNSLLRKKHFASSATGTSVTSKCKFGKGKLRDGTEICIIDTSGIFDTRKSNEETTMEIVRCIGMSSPGPHVFFFVLRIGRFTDEELKTIDHLVAIFGEDVINHVVIVFTGKDNLSHDGLTFENFLQKVPPKLNALIRKCGSRCVTIDNYSRVAEEVQADVDSIIKMVRKTINQNGGTHYTGEMYRAAEEALKEKMRLIDEEKKRKERELKKRYDALERREKELEETATKQTQQYENERQRLVAEMAALRNSNPRQQVREEMESSDGFLTTLFKAIGTAIVGAVTAVASRCTIS